MATIQLPVPNPGEGVGNYRQSYRIELDGRFYFLRFDWNSRDERWRLSVANDQRVAQVRNFPMVISTDLLRTSKARDIPQGNFAVVPTDNSGKDPGRDDFGQRCLFLYVETEE